MKKIIVSFGRFIIDISAFIVSFLVIISGIIGFCSEVPLIGFAIWIIGFFIVTIYYYFIYLAIDIRDNLESLNELAYNISKNYTNEEVDTDIV